MRKENERKKSKGKKNKTDHRPHHGNVARGWVDPTTRGWTAAAVRHGRRFQSLGTCDRKIGFALYDPNAPSVTIVGD
jgi:hypothetical protein